MRIDGTGHSDVARRLAEICGHDYTRPAGAADGVAGASARWVTRPGTVDDVGAVLRFAADRDLPVVARGAGSKINWDAGLRLDFGVAPPRLTIVLDTGRLAGVELSADGSTADVGAGTPLRAAQAVLGRSGRRLPFDSRSSDSTVGGVVAADETGPLGHRHGPPSRHLARLRYVDRTGRLVHLDGPDPFTAFHGPRGPLGVLVSVTVRTQPLPAARSWLTGPVDVPARIADLVRLSGAGRPAPAAIEVDLPAPPPGRTPTGTLAVLFEGDPDEVAAGSTRLRGEFGDSFRVSSAAPGWWSRYPFTDGDVALRITVPPPVPPTARSGLPSALLALHDLLRPAAPPVRGSAGRGVLHAVLPGDTPPETVARVVDTVSRVLVPRGGACTLVTGPAAVWRAVGG
jgi:glycolate oxidase FAD binding subunit